MVRIPHAFVMGKRQTENNNNNNNNKNKSVRSFKRSVQGGRFRAFFVLVGLRV